MDSLFDSPQFNQNLFFPRYDSFPSPRGTEDIYIEVEANVRVHARKYPLPQARFSLLFFHGNGEVASDYNQVAGAFLLLGAEMIVVDYRGYGKSEGNPTLRNTLEDAHIVYNYLQDNGELLPNVCIMGRSLGSAPTIELCSKLDSIACCVIESGYADPLPLVERRGLKIDQTTPEEDALFNNSIKIRKVQCPLLIMHGEEDYLISPKEAELNYREAGSKVKLLEILEGVGHNDMMMAQDDAYFSCLQSFFDSLPWKER